MRFQITCQLISFQVSLCYNNVVSRKMVKLTIHIVYSITKLRQIHNLKGLFLMLLFVYSCMKKLIYRILVKLVHKMMRIKMPM